MTSAMVYGLLLKCPMEQVSHNCIFSELRTLVVKQRISILTDLGIEKRCELYDQHLKCLCTREKISSVKNIYQPSIKQSENNVALQNLVKVIL